MQYLTELLVDHNLQQDDIRGSYAFPMKVYLDDFSKMEASLVQWHWHHEVELVLNLRGRVLCHIADEVFPLLPGEGLFVNANVLHMIEQEPPLDGLLRAALIDPLMVSGHNQTAIAHKYVDPLLHCAQLPYVHLSPGVRWQQSLIDHISTLIAAYDSESFGYEITIRNEISALWQELLLHNQKIVNMPGEAKISPDSLRIKTMMQYIQSNYAAGISLADIAASAGISVSECCRCFGRMLDQTPFDYLVRYRLNKAARRLVEGDESVTDIAGSVGFSTMSYFGGRFKVQFGCTPTQYRKNSHR